MKKGTSHKGLTCKCKTRHEYPAYVFAHWYEELTFTCPECNRKYSIIEGSAVLIEDVV